MLSSIRRPPGVSYLFISAAMLLLCSLPAVAQDQDEAPPRPKAEIRLTGGASGFTGDDGEIPDLQRSDHDRHTGRTRGGAHHRRRRIAASRNEKAGPGRRASGVDRHGR